MSKWTIGKRLGISFAGMLVLLVAISLASLNATSTLKSSFDTAAGKTAKKIALAGQLDTATSDMLASQRGFIMRSFANDKAYMASERLDFDRNAEKANAAILEIKPLLTTEEGKRLLEGLSSSVAQWVTNFAEVERLCNSGDTAGGLSFATANIVPLFKKAGESADRLVAEQQQLLQNDVADAATLNAREYVDRHGSYRTRRLRGYPGAPCGTGDQRVVENVEWRDDELRRAGGKRGPRKSRPSPRNWRVEPPSRQRRLRRHRLLPSRSAQRPK